jgi:hypothetical protein
MQSSILSPLLLSGYTHLVWEERMRKSIVIILCATVVFVLMTTSCLPGHMRFEQVRPAGFFMGIWHGWLAPVSLIVSLCNPAVRIYETINTGWWYDFGFYIAIISGFGGISLGVCRTGTVKNLQSQYRELKNSHLSIV